MKHYKLRTKKLVGDDFDTAENLAKEWLFEELHRYIIHTTNIKKEELENIFKTSILNYDLICFIQNNSVYHIQTEHYYHE